MTHVDTRLGEQHSRDTQPAVPKHPGCHSIQAPWACVHTHQQAERWANTNLQRLGYETFLPMATIRRRDRVTPTLRHTAQAPLFPRYLFVRFDPQSQSWSPIRACPGVHDLVRCGAEIPKMEDVALEALRSAVEGRGEFSASTDHQGALWAPGVPCSLATGPFRGHQGVVLQVGVDTALISLLVFGALREVLVQQSNLLEREA